MKLSTINKELLDKEFEFALNKMETSQTPDELIYYFSGFFNVINRIYNIEFSEELLFINFVMDIVYNSFMGRIGLVKAGQSPVIGFHEDFGSALIKITKDIKDNFYDKQKCIQALQKLVLLSFTTTGNGFYLSQKKPFKLPLEGEEETKKLTAK